MTATGDLREQLIHARNLLQKALDEVDDAVRLADRLDDEAIDAAQRFVARSAG